MKLKTNDLTQIASLHRVVKNYTKMKRIKKQAAHRPLKYGEETVMVHFRVPKSRKSAIQEQVKIILDSFAIRK